LRMKLHSVFFTPVKMGTIEIPNRFARAASHDLMASHGGSVMKKIIEEGRADLISMSRPFIREPFLISKFRTGEIKKSEYISCNKCFNLRRISCAELKKE
jgi:2,4-dienoyl-CoA reductase-like NADH-dependent reductase (Old Yellow Enzyme family)